MNQAGFIMRIGRLPELLVRLRAAMDAVPQAQGMLRAGITPAKLADLTEMARPARLAPPGVAFRPRAPRRASGWQRRTWAEFRRQMR